MDFDWGYIGLQYSIDLLAVQNWEKPLGGAQAGETDV